MLSTEFKNAEGLQFIDLRKAGGADAAGADAPGRGAQARR